MTPIANIYHLSEPIDFLLGKHILDYFEQTMSFTLDKLGAVWDLTNSLIKLLNDAKNAIARDNVIFLMFYDYSCAFNWVWDSIFLQTVQRAGLDGDSIQLTALISIANGG